MQCIRFLDGDAFEVEVSGYHHASNPGGSMSIPYTRVMTRRPSHPGEMLREDFLPDYGL
jgi:hypothetical protein